MLKTNVQVEQMPWNWVKIIPTEFFFILSANVKFAPEDISGFNIFNLHPSRKCRLQYSKLQLLRCKPSHSQSQTG